MNLPAFLLALAFCFVIPWAIARHVDKELAKPRDYKGNGHGGGL